MSLPYFIAQKYVDAFAELARSPQAKTVIVPADMAGITGSIAGIAELVKTAISETPRSSQPPRTPQPPGVPRVGS